MKKEEKVKINSLDNFFNEEEVVDLDDFFSDEDDIVTPKKKEEKKEEDDHKKEEEEKDDPFEDEDEEEEEKDDPKKKKEEKDEKKEISNVEMINTLKERGIINFELEEGEELTEEDALDLIEESFETSVQEQVESLFKDLPPVVKQFNKFVYDGGDPMKFISTFKSISKDGLTLNIDLNKEENQQKVLEVLLKEEGLDDDLIETQLTFLKDGGKLKAFAEKKYNNWKEAEVKKQEKLLEEQEAIKEQRRFKEKEYKKDISDFVSKNEKIGPLPLTKNDKKNIVSYITDRNVKLKNGQSISSFYADLESVLSKKETLLQLAKLLRLRDKTGNFDFKEIEKDIQSSVTKNLKNKINKEENRSLSSRDRSRENKITLIDFLEGN